MEYTIKAHPTTYNGVEFRSRLEATWAAFFDLIGWDGERHDSHLGPTVISWEYEPVDLEGWTPDFVITVRSLLGGSEGGSWKYFVEIKPFESKESFIETSAYRYLLNNRSAGELGEPEVMFMGLNPSYAWRELPFLKSEFVKEDRDMWKQAQNVTRWRP